MAMYLHRDVLVMLRRQVAGITPYLHRNKKYEVFIYKLQPRLEYQLQIFLILTFEKVGPMYIHIL